MKRITHVKCLEPFLLFGIHDQGYCGSCCPAWTKVGFAGRLTDSNSLLDIWNGKKMQQIRQAVLDDSLGKICNFKYCPYAMKNTSLNLESLKNDDQNFNRVIDQIMAGKTIMETPPYTLLLANSRTCNLNCIMCNSNNKYTKRDELLDERIFGQLIPEILPGISRLFMSGFGEVFFNKYSRRFLQSLDSSRYPSLKIRLLTNATLFTPELWKSISQNRYELISVSIDAASKATYEKIRKNGNWEILRRNLELIGQLRRQNVFQIFDITFVVMRSNYQEMKQFVELGLSLGCDHIIFQKIFGKTNIKENINFIKDKQVFAGIGKILRDPIFDRPEVDSTLINEYRGYSEQNVNLWDPFFSKAK